MDSTIPRKAIAVGLLTLCLPLVGSQSPAAASESAGSTTSTQGSAGSEPDGLQLPSGFSATIVADSVGPARHLAIRDNGDIYISTRSQSRGIIAIRQGSGHKAIQIEHFGSVAGGTGIAFYHGDLYASSPADVYRYTFERDELIPSKPPQVIVSGMPEGGFTNRGLAFDSAGSLYVDVGGSGNICAKPDSKPLVGLDPCPSLTGRAGIWRFDAQRQAQMFPSDGEQIATGVRDMSALAWSAKANALYGVMQGRNGTSTGWPKVVSSDEDANGIAEEMHRISKGANLGWPYTYFDSIRHRRLLAPEYGGDSAVAPSNKKTYSEPVVALPAHSSPTDLVFYDATLFPSRYRGGAFISLQGGTGKDLATGHHGYEVVFVPMKKDGKAGKWTVFADGFAGPEPHDRNLSPAHYRPVGVAVGPDGALYVVDSKKGRLWRIAYTKSG